MHAFSGRTIQEPEYFQFLVPGERNLPRPYQVKQMVPGNIFMFDHKVVLHQ